MRATSGSEFCSACEFKLLPAYSPLVTAADGARTGTELMQAQGAGVYDMPSATGDDGSTA